MSVVRRCILESLISHTERAIRASVDCIMALVRMDGSISGN